MSQSIVPPGFFGKVPARGDFLVRRMPAALQAAWENWLSSLVVAARAALGEEWPQAWLTAPLWHFTLGNGIAPQSGAAGVLLASVDRVGRFFPLSILGLAAPRTDLRADGWAQAAESLALAALDDDFDPDRLDAALSDLGPPPATGGSDLPNGVWRLPIENGWPARSVDRLSDAAWLPPGPRQSAWWCRGSERMVPVHLRVTGLPHERLAAAMVTGTFGPADGGDAALGPLVRSIAPVSTPSAQTAPVAFAADPPMQAPTTPQSGTPQSGTPQSGTPEIEGGRIDPFGEDPDWTGSLASSGHDAATGEPAPSGLAGLAGPGVEALPERDPVKHDPLKFLLRDDDPLADGSG